MTDDLERRTMIGATVTATDSRRLRGYAVVFHARSLDLGGFVEVINPDAVDRTLAEAIDVRALVDHEPGKVIGRTRAGTLELRKDRHGLEVTIEPDQGISYASDIMKAVARGDVTGMSFGFRVVDEEWQRDAGQAVRIVRDMRISEVSIVSFPAYPQTDVAVALRSLAAFRRVHQPSAAYRARQLRQMKAS